MSDLDSSKVISGFDSSEVEEQTITVTYEGLTCEYKVTVEEKKVVSIEIVENPKTDYKVGETLDLSDGVIKITYSDGTTEEISMEDSNVVVDGFDSSEAGENTVTVSYDGVSVSYVVNIKEVVSIKIKTRPTVTYTSGDSLDLSEGVITVTYSDGTTEEVSMLDDSVTVTGFNTLSLGTQVLTVTYEGVSTTFSVYVDAASVDEEDKGEDSEEETESSSGTSSKSSAKSVNTGDNIIAYVIMLVVSFGLICVITKKMNKKNK